jgi:hypothetical protein
MTHTINIVHIILIGPILLYLALEKNIHKYVYDLLLALGIILAFYFMYMIYSHKLSSYHVWLIIHLLIFAPLLMWIGFAKEQTPRIILSLLLAVGCAAIGYHFIRLIQKLQFSL